MPHTRRGCFCLPGLRREAALGGYRVGLALGLDRVAFAVEEVDGEVVPELLG